jgi:hypothetical protein
MPSPPPEEDDKCFKNSTCNTTGCNPGGGGSSDEFKTLELCDGFYTPKQLAEVLTSLFCKNGDKIIVKYNPIIQKFTFYSSVHNPFKFHFDYMIPSDSSCTNCCNVWCQPTKWGLGSYLGFEKKTYYSNASECNESCLCSSDLYMNISPFNEEIAPICSQLTTDCSGETGEDCHYQCIIAPLFPKLSGEKVIYMELDKFNSYDELCPYPTKSNNLFNAKYGGAVNSAFAKISLVEGPLGSGAVAFDSRIENFINISYHNPPLERIQKLKFKFRHHNGELVDFKDVPFTFTIEFNCLRNDIATQYKVQLPSMY